jgi:hypothetical protein
MSDIIHFTKVDCGVSNQNRYSESDGLTDVNCPKCLRKVQELFESYHEALYGLAEYFIDSDGATRSFTERARDELITQGFLEYCNHCFNGYHLIGECRL